MAPLVMVLGDATLDVRAGLFMPMRPAGDVPASVTLGPGGQGANIAVRLARRGVRTRLVCRIGDDAAGGIVRSAIVRDGVDVVDGGAPFTGVVVVLVDATGDRTMLSQRVPLLEPSGLPDVSVLDADWVIISGYVLLERGAGISMTGDAPPRRVVCGCSLEPGTADDWIRGARSLQPHIVVMNLDEAKALWADDLEPADLSRSLGQTLGALVIITEPSGATAAVDDEVAMAITPQTDEPAVDTTGAGDAFTAGLVSELLDAPWPPAVDRVTIAMRAAATLAAAVTRVPGAQARVPGEE
jgi:ribokinase